MNTNKESISIAVASNSSLPSSSPPCSAMAAPPSPPVGMDLRAILFESKRIINTHSCHFLALSVLFLLPLSFSSAAYPAIYQLFFQSPTLTIENLLSHLANPFLPRPPIFTIKTIIFTLLYNIFVSIFTLLATGSIIYSVFHSFYGTPVKLVSAIKSAFTSFFRLVSTYLISELINYGIFFIFVLVLLSLVMAALLLGYQVNFSSPYFTSLWLLFLIIFVPIVVYLQVIWTFAYVVVVVESSWGFEPLKRTQNLVKEQKRVAFSMLLFFGYFGWISSRASAAWSDSAADKWKNGASVLIIMATSTFFMLFKLYILVASTVFYMYSKAMHGDLAGKITEESAREYVSLPFDDAKVPHVVSVLSSETSV